MNIYKTIFRVAFLLAMFQSTPGRSQGGRPAIPEEDGKRNLDSFATTFHDKASWEKRATLIRQNILKGLQLKPLPAKTDLKPILRNKKVMNGYTVENVAFESKPGFWVTGNLYKPLNTKGKLAGILCPTGHSQKPAEARGNEDWQKLCAGLAKMGAVVLAYDMAGYSEATQCEHKIAIAAKIHSWNSMRGIDFLLTQKEVDPNRIAVTGASGGGTQTFLLTALDKRVAVSAPVVMVSAYFYGGCVCESGMPIHTGPGIETNNAEIAALMAPKPMIVVSDGKDWTKNVPNVEFPYIKNVYGLYGATGNVQNAHFPEEGHDYKFSKRKPVYAFFAQHLKLDLSKITNASNEIDESFITVQPYSALKVFTEGNPRPAYAVMGNDKVIALFSSK
ncbi:MAG: acetyl xylan esterase [Segetibacter sp.]|nr:acetyl xylan esterase [Segetibacter sp.]